MEKKGASYFHNPTPKRQLTPEEKEKRRLQRIAEKVAQEQKEKERPIEQKNIKFKGLEHRLKEIAFCLEFVHWQHFYSAGFLDGLCRHKHLAAKAHLKFVLI